MLLSKLITLIYKITFNMKKRQYRSNQGRNPEKELETFKLLKITLTLGGILLTLLILKNLL